MAVLTNITVVIADLKAIRPNITDYQYDTESDDFAEEILRAKETLYRMVKDNERQVNPSLSEAELTALLVKIKDIDDVQYLKERLTLISISEIFKANDLLDLSRTYADDAQSISLEYYIDKDADDIITDSEEREFSGVTFGR